MSEDSYVSSTNTETDVQLKQLFGACDRKGKGYVVREELEELCLTLGISREDSDAIFCDLDLNNDGRVTFSDFSSGFQEFLNPESEESFVKAPTRRRASMWTPELTARDKIIPKTKNKTNRSLRKTAKDSQFILKTLRLYIKRPQLAPFDRKHTTKCSKKTRTKFSLRNNEKLFLRNFNLTFKSLNLTFKSLKHSSKKSFSPGPKQEKDNPIWDDDDRDEIGMDEIPSWDRAEEINERRKRESVYHAWTNFTSSLVEFNLLSLSPESQVQIRQLYKELQGRNFPPAVVDKVDSAVKSLMNEMGKLQMENKTLEELYNREKTTHVKTLMSLEEEIEDQVARVEERARKEANMEKEVEKRQLQEQMDLEVAEMQAHLKIFQKVDSWLKNDHSADGDHETKKKLEDANVVNRELRMALNDTTSNLAVFRSDLAHSRLQYEEKCRELHHEREQVLEYMHQYDHLRRQLDLIHEANKRLQDTNDSLRQYVEIDWRSPSISRTSSQRSSVRRNLTGSRSLPPILSLAASEAEFSDARDGGLHRSRSRLLEDLDSGMSTMVDKTEEVSVLGNDDSLLFTSNPPSLEEELRNSQINNSNGLRNENPEIIHRLSPNLTELNSDKDLVAIPPPPPAPGWPICNTGTEESSLRFCKQNDERDFVPDRTYKVVLAGDIAVGKSTFIARICKGEFVPNMAATLGVDYKVKSLKLDNKHMVIQLWDTAGQERFRSITKCYFRRADGVLLLYDVTNEKSFLNIRQWVQDINESCVNKIPLILCGNKTDVREEVSKQNRKVVTSIAGDRLALENEAQFFETSTKDGGNVMDAFIELARLMVACEDMAIHNSALRIIAGGKKKNKCCGSRR